MKEKMRTYRSLAAGELLHDKCHRRRHWQPGWIEFSQCDGRRSRKRQTDSPSAGDLEQE